jgi:uncharacterized Zn-binding protein involved in type VI secretion
VPAIARIGDPGSHGGEIITGASQSFCEGPAIARKGDLYGCPIHGPNKIVTGAAQSLCEGAQIARVGDFTECGAQITAGALKSFCE